MTEEISIIIPAYNEAVGLPDVINKIHVVFQGVSHYEIVVIDDGSIDETKAVAASHGARVLVNPTNMGYGFSLKRGFRAARNDCTVMVDADGTYPIEKIPELITEYEKGFDMVVGARQGKEYYSSFTKSIARHFFKWMSEFVVGKKIPDINSGLRVVRRSKIMPHLADLSNAFSFTTSTTLIFFLQHYFIKYVPIQYQARQGKTKVKYVRDALRTMQIMMEIIAVYNPIKLFLLIASLPAAVALVLLVIGLTRYLILLTILAVPLFGLSLLIIALGFMATVLRKR